MIASTQIALGILIFAFELFCFCLYEKPKRYLWFGCLALSVGHIIGYVTWLPLIGQVDLFWVRYAFALAASLTMSYLLQQRVLQTTFLFIPYTAAAIMFLDTDESTKEIVYMVTAGSAYALYLVTVLIMEKWTFTTPVAVFLGAHLVWVFFSPGISGLLDESSLLFLYVGTDIVLKLATLIFVLFVNSRLFHPVVGTIRATWRRLKDWCSAEDEGTELDERNFFVLETDEESGNKKQAVD